MPESGYFWKKGGDKSIQGIYKSKKREVNKMAKNNANDEGWQRPKGSFGDTYSFDKEGQTLEGTLMSKRESVGPYGSIAYGVLVDDILFTLWGSVNLDMQMAEIPEGSRVRITYLGREENPKTKREFGKYEVLFKPPKTQKAADLLKEEDIPF